MKKFLGRLYLAYGAFWFLSVFLLLYPLFLLFIWIKPLMWLTYVLNKIWSAIFFPFSFIRVQPHWHFKPKKGEAYAYVSNHGSYLDIPVLTWVLPGFICFIGKDSLAKIPLFGYMFRSIHITLNRESRQDGRRSLEESKKKLAEGRSLVFFAEGRINHYVQPGLLPFKDGAFRAAIAQQVPVVPVAIPYNWLIMPDDGQFIARYKPCPVILHKPISTIGLTEKDVEPLKKQVYDIILAEMQRYNPVVNTTGHTYRIKPRKRDHSNMADEIAALETKHLDHPKHENN